MSTKPYLAAEVRRVLLLLEQASGIPGSASEQLAHARACIDSAAPSEPADLVDLRERILDLVDRTLRAPADGGNLCRRVHDQLATLVETFAIP